MLSQQARDQQHAARKKHIARIAMLGAILDTQHLQKQFNFFDCHSAVFIYQRASTLHCSFDAELRV
jgi:hypothetical protein